eukprot:NODE_567_length_6607_cov_0.300553.p4 type:complete len:112 gc:universal NODE_567_length_6607_cov_0.300553:4428-4763(+)
MSKEFQSSSISTENMTPQITNDSLQIPNGFSPRNPSEADKIWINSAITDSTKINQEDPKFARILNSGNASVTPTTTDAAVTNGETEPPTKTVSSSSKLKMAVISLLLLSYI